eukprot:7378281-Prymnesium_polylepis.1
MRREGACDGAQGVGVVARCSVRAAQHRPPTGEHAQHRTRALHTHMHKHRRRPWHSERCLVGCACGIGLSHHVPKK